MEKHLYNYYYDRVFSKGMKLFSDMSYDEKRTLEKSLGFADYRLDMAVDNLKRKLLKRIS